MFGNKGEGLLQACISSHRDYLKKQAVKLNSDTYHEAYKKCKNQVTKLIRSSKKQYYQTKLENSKDSKDSWKYINELLNRKPKRTAVNQLQVDGQTGPFLTYILEGPKPPQPLCWPPH